MAYLSPTSAAALARIRAFVPPPTNYHSLPLTRRAAVLILLFADRSGGLRVVLTIRSTKLRNYAGQAALPGGKADSLEESPWETARREAWEEIGLPMGDGEIMRGWRVERLGELPCNLAVTELGVRPCVGYLSPVGAGHGDETKEGSTQSASKPDPVSDLLPTLDAKEVAAVFTAPFQNFLRKEDIDERVRKNVPGKWYNGTWVSWHEEAWRMHQFFVPKGMVFRSGTDKKGDDDNPAIGDEKAPGTSGLSGGPAETSSNKKKRVQGKVIEEARTKEKEAAAITDPLDEPRYKVFGMTARILVDAARVAYGEEPEYEHNSHFGDEDMIHRLMRMGRLAPIKKEGETLTREVMTAAAKM
ncbi:hypothetical protein CAC42_2780 [Sphaceloma murrayae]|uniref:Nudix hydrolase domain-containing protein n=1 Tax=Sphaceloma murrayae TaxID=2082308 RepID=A0A2K1R0M6_9PEZI|nr:hypothetical protein CAC42_2780 [Sphaceloma murrayae]